ncbi:uncharacterized protein LOC143288165 [Babylonia areolata]|uniref:uncharacterized protein LOC143288165 n=1 Tax=Babylonia areolata TaxID=304850 RepID=UPI003FD3037B
MKAWSVFHVLTPSAVPALLLTLTLVLSSSSSSSSSSSVFRAGDDSDEDYSSFASDEGSGPDDEDLSYLFTDVMASDVTFRCYRCTGVQEQSGCNVTSLRENPADYVTDCDGHCLNISSAESTVFDCTATVPVRSATCFHNDGILMCVCNSDLCNGPPLLPAPEDVVPLPTSQREVNLTSLQGVNVTSANPGQGEADVTDVTSEQGNDDTNTNTNTPTVTSKDLGAKPPPQRINVTSYQSLVNVTSPQGVGVTLRNATSPPRVAASLPPSPPATITTITPRPPLNVTSPQHANNGTSPRENLSSGKVGEVADVTAGR